MSTYQIAFKMQFACIASFGPPEHTANQVIIVIFLRFREVQLLSPNHTAQRQKNPSPIKAKGQSYLYLIPMHLLFLEALRHSSIFTLPPPQIKVTVIICLLHKTQWSLAQDQFSGNICWLEKNLFIPAFMISEVLQKLLLFKDACTIGHWPVQECLQHHCLLRFWDPVSFPHLPHPGV